jgi:dihydropteroate synthase type 2
LPVLISVTRKSFLRAHSGRDIEEIAPMSLAAELWATQMGVTYIRTHDVAQLHDALSLHKTLHGLRP